MGLMSGEDVHLPDAVRRPARHRRSKSKLESFPEDQYADTARGDDRTACILYSSRAMTSDASDL